MIHPAQFLGSGASPVEGMRIIDSECLARIREKIKSLGLQLANPNTATTATEVAKRLSQFELDSAAFVNAFSVPVK